MDRVEVHANMDGGWSPLDSPVIVGENWPSKKIGGGRTDVRWLAAAVQISEVHVARVPVGGTDHHDRRASGACPRRNHHNIHHIALDHRG